MDKQFNLITVVEAIQKRFKLIVIITLAVLAGTYVITIPGLKIFQPKFESTATFYSANLSLTDRPYLFEAKSAVDVELNLFGNSQDIDRLVSIALSRQVLKQLVEKFNLIQYYKINEQKVKSPEAAAISQLKSNYKAMKNEYNSVEIHMIDTDRQLAADIVNEAVSIIDKINRDMVMEGRQYMISLLEKHTDMKKKEISELFSKISETGDDAQKNTLELQRNLSAEQLAHYYNVLDQFRLITSDDISTIRVMEKAYPAEKEEPYRYLFIVGTFLMTLFVLILGATILHVMTK